MKACLLSFVLAVSVLGAPRNPAAPPKSAVIQYLAGVELIKSSGSNDTLKAKRYRQLTQVTRVTAAEASAFIASYKNRPRDWQKIWGKVLKILESQTPPAKPASPDSIAARHTAPR
jgi:hypothetical protein